MERNQKQGGGNEEEESNETLDSSSKLYEAYNELHGLAQEFSMPFDAPAILVVGHQTDGKSALVEALMGFQFNHVGGGTKTRRPITLHMTYNPSCSLPRCCLVSGDGDVEGCGDRRMSLEEIQVQARAVEALVRAKMQHKEFIILCLEDCSDWSNATTRRIVMQIDPELSRTVLVSTKLDTKIPQFARSSDVEVFLRPPARILDGCLLGDSPFFTSIPSGRVGSERDSVYSSNEEFKKAISLRELEDIACLEEKLGRLLSKEERSRIGVSSLRLFLEELLQKKYMESVPLIIPLLDKEYRSTTRKLRDINQEICNLDEMKLKEKGRAFHDSFLAKLSLLLKGTVVAPPDKFGETLQDERTNGGMFIGADGQFSQKMMPNAGMRLYGGAQYHRAMAEFRLVVGGVKCPPITREEIVNACGVEDIHDGTNYSRTACVIAVAKARDTFEPFLHQLGYRLLYILKRLLPISIYLLQKDGEHLSGHEVFLKRVEVAFNNFAETTERACRDKCMEDLVCTTRYVTWSLHNKNRAGLRQFLDSFASMDHSSFGGNSSCSAPTQQNSSLGPVNNDTKLDNKKTDTNSCSHTTETRLVDLLDSTLWNRRLAPSSERIVYALVHQIFHGIKEQFLVSTELKFNCFLLMPVVDKLPALLREDLESAFEDDLDSIFDITQLRSSLGQHKRDLEIELKRIDRLKEKFREIHGKLNSNCVHPKNFSALA
ncbi:dynamin-like protein ARC5 isoform X3 [Asparagus officinalis]|uniref:dynamin-like protein ARC5 isoform X3 n=1 Tax=Asparagus officinalis TaxID=4686 RepID=UPI00098E0F19|nr:dynamin-like protein ARC5 isoform X3 [Asparagus officinalis]